MKHIYNSLQMTTSSVGDEHIPGRQGHPSISGIIHLPNANPGGDYVGQGNFL